MAFIDIYTNNLSRELRNSTTFIDNWAYVPGNTITGDYKKIHFFTSLDDFKNTCGSRAVEGSKTFAYVSGLLNAGIPVLFRRIACKGQDSGSETLGVVKASTYLTHYDSDTSADVNDVKITERYGGTYGNDINVVVRNTGSAIWMDIYLKYSLLERKRLAKITTGESQLEINQSVIDALKADPFERVQVEVLIDDPAKFTLSETTSPKYLSGGTDFVDDDVKAEIPKSFDFITDKILYQPKFLTSGGYTDNDLTESADIANAMIKLSQVRQDCRALIDIPSGIPAGEQQEQARAVAYQQLSDDQVIPSASICAPWQYMQVGTEQLWMPPSYVYLTVMGSSLSKGGAAYTPKAGITSGQVSNIIQSQFEIGSDLAQKWQSDTDVNINPIMKLQGGRYVIAGNSTLLLPDSVDGENNAFSESSADLAIIEIRRFVYNLGTELQYQYNSTDAFETFALRTSNFLDQMESDGAVVDYTIANVSSNDDPRTLKIQLNVYVAPTIKNIKIYLNVAYGSIELTSGGEE